MARLVLFDQQLTLLYQHHPQLAELVNSRQEDAVLIFQKSQTGLPVVMVHQNEQKFALHHPNDPIAHAQQYLNGIEQLPKAQNILLMGFGLGYVPLILTQMIPNFNQLIIVEPSLSVFRKALEMIDFRNLLQHPKIQFIVGQKPSNLYSIITKNLMEYTANPILMLDYPPVTSTFPQWTENVRQQINDAMRLAQSGLQTKWRDGPLTLQNLIQNIKFIVNSPGIRDVGTLCQNIPAVIVAAGPSLMKNIDILQQHQSKVLIIATDTIYNTLLNHNIIPEFVITVDPTELNLKHFSSSHYGPDSFLIFDPESRTEIIQKFTNRITYMTDKHSFFSWLNHTLNNKGLISKGGMVSQAGIQIAHYFGCSPIILVGQDLALDQDSLQTHAPETALSRKIRFFENDSNYVEVDTPDLSNLNREPIFWVDGQTDQKVPTVQSFLVYLRMLEEDIGKINTPVINATEGGARIAGTHIQTLNETLNKLPQPTKHLSEIMTEMLIKFRQWTPENTQKIKKDLFEKLNKCHAIAKEGQKELNRQSKDSPQELEERLHSYREKLFSDPIAEYLIEYAAPRPLFEFLKRGPSDATADEKRAIIKNRWQAMIDAVNQAQDFLHDKLK